MSMNEHIEVEDLAMLALLTEEPDTAQAGRSSAREHLQTCPECKTELQRVRADLGLYALLRTEPVVPPAGARDRFLTSLRSERPRSEEPSVAPAAGATATSGMALVPSSARPRQSAMGRVMPWIGWAIAAAAVLVAFGLRQDRDSLRQALTQQDRETARLQADESRARELLSTLTGPTAVRVNLTEPKAKPQPNARATYQPRTGTLLLLASNLAPLPTQKVYELWLIPANGGKPIPAGTFAPDAHGNGSLLVPTLAGATAAKAFGITVEPEGGSSTPTMPILLAGSPG